MGQYIENLVGTGLPQMQHPLLRMGVILMGLIKVNYHRGPSLGKKKNNPNGFYFEPNTQRY